MTYHSQWAKDASVPTLNGIAFLPIKTQIPGPAKALPMDSAEEDIIDEALRLFRAMILFKNFEVQGPADKTLIFLTVYISKCLEVIHAE